MAHQALRIAKRRARTGQLVSWERRQARWYEGLVLPAVVILAAVTIVPFVWLGAVSLTPLNMAQPGSFHLTGVSAYLDLTTDHRFLNSLAVQFRLSALAVGLQVLLGLASAVLLNQNLPGTAVFRTVLIAPMMLPPIIVAVIWKVPLSPDISVVNWALGQIHLPQPLWLTDPRLALWSIIIADTWEWTPFVMLILLAGLQYIPQDPQEAALIDGASQVQRFFCVTLPLLQPVLAVAALFRLIDSVKTFPLIFLMTFGGPGDVTETTNYYAYLQAFAYGLIGYSGRISVILLALKVALTAGIARRVGETTDVE